MPGIHTAAENIAAAAEPIRPTPEQVDALADRWFIAAAESKISDSRLAAVEAEAIEVVKLFGTVRANAENSRELIGKLSELMVTIGNTITIDEARVQDFKEALEANGYGHLFPNIFQPRSRHELVKGAEKAIVAAGLNKRLTEKLLGLYGRCFEAKKKSPALKVKRIIVNKVKRQKKAASEVA